MFFGDFFRISTKFIDFFISLQKMETFLKSLKKLKTLQKSKQKKLESFSKNSTTKLTFLTTKMCYYHQT